MSSHFYSSLPPFRRFEEFVDEAHYRPLPTDWHVYVTDVVNSTGAIAAGKYREVNLVGAASITLCIKLLGELRFPFVFGGDGASLCIPAAYHSIVDTELGQLMRLAKENFGLELRVARIPVLDIVAGGTTLDVARFELTAGSTLAFFRGGGMEAADRLAKRCYEQYAVPIAAQPVEELTGLSCRWSPIPARRGCVLSLLVKVTEKQQGQEQAVFAELLQQMQSVMGESLDAANPASLAHVRYKSLWRAITEERHYHRSVLSVSFLKRMIEIVLAIVIFRHGINVAKSSFDSRHYVQSVGVHSDYRKFDDTLRLVLDCTLAQSEALETVLEAARRRGAIHYGLHQAGEALMTCFVETMQEGGHLHFIDGGSGGLSLASRQLKAQQASLE